MHISNYIIYLQRKILDTVDKYARTFYGLKSATVLDEQNVSNTSAYYEDHIIDLSGDLAEIESPIHKKRKIQVQEKVVKGDIVREKLISTSDNNTTANEIVSRGEQRINNQTYDQQHYRNASSSINYVQPSNLSESVSTDAFSAEILSANGNMLVYTL